MKGVQLLRTADEECERPSGEGEEMRSNRQGRRRTRAFRRRRERAAGPGKGRGSEAGRAAWAGRRNVFLRPPVAASAIQAAGRRPRAPQNSQENHSMHAKSLTELRAALDAKECSAVELAITAASDT